MMVRRLCGWTGFAVAALVMACGGGGSGSGNVTTQATQTDGGVASNGGSSPDGGSPTTQPGAGSDAGTPGGGDGGVAQTAPPITKDNWTFYDTSQGLSQTIQDVSADEAGNVYVAGEDAIYAKKRGDQGFLRFDAASAGLTQNCYQGVPPENDPGFGAALGGTTHPTPPGPPVMCPILSVAGAASGTAVLGFKGHGTDSDGDATWAMDSGGADVVTFDGTALKRVRHVLVASPPETICAANNFETHATSCSNPYDFYWTNGREKLRQVFRIVANHRQGTPGYGDVWMGGTHATLTALLQNAAARGYMDRTAGQSSRWADAKDVWEHDHPAIYDPVSNLFLTGYTYAIAIDPRSGIPWASNGFRTAWMAGYGSDLHDDVWYLLPVDAAHPTWIDVWPDGTGSPIGPAQDHTMSLSFCDDGTLWMGSSTHGLAVQDPSGAMSGIDLPNTAGNGDDVLAVACDPSDGSLWIGLGWGGVMRYKNGQFTTLDTTGLPGFANQPVQSIQIDRWTTPRIVYFAFVPTTDSTGKIVHSGGVAAYSGP